MRPKKHETTGSVRARLDQIINMRHELVQLAGKIDWEFIDGEIAPLYSDGGRPGIAIQSMAAHALSPLPGALGVAFSLVWPLHCFYAVVCPHVLPTRPGIGPSSDTGRRAQILPPAGATVPPWLPRKVPMFPICPPAAL